LARRGGESVFRRIATGNSQRDGIIPGTPNSAHLGDVGHGYCGLAYLTEGQQVGILGRIQDRQISRLAITGQKVSPPLFESMQAMGRELVLQRLDEALAILG
jgi:glutamyl/glutaminyl-tRNA synthetase